MICLQIVQKLLSAISKLSPMLSSILNINIRNNIEEFWVGILTESHR